MLDYSCIRNFSVGVIYNRVALMVFLVKYLCFKAYRTVLKRTVFKSEELIDLTCVYSLVGNVGIFLDKLKIIGACLYIRACEHFFDYLCISAHRDTLIAVVEVVVVIYKSERKTLDYE